MQKVNQTGMYVCMYIYDISLPTLDQIRQQILNKIRKLRERRD